MIKKEKLEQFIEDYYGLAELTDSELDIEGCVDRMYAYINAKVQENITLLLDETFSRIFNIVNRYRGLSDPFTAKYISWEIHDLYEKYMGGTDNEQT